jgi:hypothetical protein
MNLANRKPGIDTRLNLSLALSINLASLNQVATLLNQTQTLFINLASPKPSIAPLLNQTHALLINLANPKVGLGTLHDTRPVHKHGQPQCRPCYPTGLSPCSQTWPALRQV